MRPLIGITASHNEENCQVYLRENYAQAVLNAGGLPVILPQTADRAVLSDYLDKLDGVLLSGGGDIDPKYYHEEMIPACGAPDARRDAHELTLTELAMARQMPILGICRGCQVLAVALGCALIQDLETERGIPAGRHRQGEHFEKPAHRIDLSPSGILARITGAGSIAVNSSHHQAVRILSPGLFQEAVSEDGVIEAFSAGDNILAVQFHPEYMAESDPNAQAIFGHFLKQAGDYQSRNRSGK